MRKIKREAFEEFSSENVSTATVSNLPVFSKIKLSCNEPKSHPAVTIHLNDFTIDVQDGTSETTILNALRASYGNPTMSD